MDVDLLLRRVLRSFITFVKSITSFMIVSPDIVYRDIDAVKKPFDMVVFAAHPDDAELSCGGAIAQMAAVGKNVAIVECTRGEMGSRGTPEQRRNEAIAAASILGLAERWNLAIPDGGIHRSSENLHKIVAAIRYFEPTILLFPAGYDRHLDHEDAHNLVRTAVFQSGLTKIQTEVFGQSQPPYRPQQLFCYMQTYEFEPHFYINISEYFSVKMQSIYAHASQVFVPGANSYSNEPETFISSPSFMNFIESRARHFGGKIGVEYAEGFLSIEPLAFSSLNLFL